MANIAGSIPIGGFIAPTDINDVYATQDERFNRGGYRSVETITDRDNVTPDRRTIGMLIFVLSNNKTYRLIGGLENSNWEEFEIAGGGSGELVEVVENGKTGLVLHRDDRVNKGPIGQDSLDLSTIDTATDLVGPLGDRSFSIGVDSTIVGRRSASIGNDNIVGQIFQDIEHAEAGKITLLGDYVKFFDVTKKLTLFIDNTNSPLVEIVPVDFSSITFDGVLTELTYNNVATPYWTAISDNGLLAVKANNDKFLGDNSIALGDENIVSGNSSLSLGSKNVNDADYTYNLGLGLIAKNRESVNLGKFNVGSTTDILQIGSGTSNEDRRTSLSVNSNGIIVLNNQNGNITNNDHAATKKYVDDKLKEPNSNYTVEYALKGVISYPMSIPLSGFDDTKLGHLIVGSDIKLKGFEIMTGQSYCPGDSAINVRVSYLDVPANKYNLSQGTTLLSSSVFITSIPANTKYNRNEVKLIQPISMIDRSILFVDISVNKWIIDDIIIKLIFGN